MSDRRAHPLALYAWAILRDRARVDRQLVFHALARRLQNVLVTEDQAVAAHALERAAEALGRAPSRRAYDDFRDSQDDRTSWPSAQLIRNAFGGWSAALTAVFGADPMGGNYVTASRLTATGSRFGRAELIGLIQMWSETVPEAEPLRSRAFLEWCRGPAEGLRGALSLKPLDRVFGGWTGALEAAGLAHRKWRNGGSYSGRLPLPLRLDEQSLMADYLDAPPPPPPADHWTRDHLRQWLQWIATPLSPQHRVGLTVDGYNARRRAAVEAAHRRGRSLHVPSARSIIKAHDGLWTRAKREAGLLGAEASPMDGGACA